MDKRNYDFSRYYRDTETNDSCEHCSFADSKIPSCINTDFCLPTPTDMNNGILTMAFVDMQPLDSVYPEETAFRCGTLFPNLNKPFYGGMKR